MSAEKCPVCGGTGKYLPPPNPAVTQVPLEQTCHGCGGKGWVETNSTYPWNIYYPDPCDTCPHKRPYQITWGNY
jgi:DnaJ-class molecular chaperone